MQDAMKTTHSENYRQGIKFGGLVGMSMCEYTTRLISTSSFAWFRGCSSIASTHWTASSAQGWQAAAPFPLVIVQCMTGLSSTLLLVLSPHCIWVSWHSLLTNSIVR